MRKLEFVKDDNGIPTNVLPLNDSQDVDGTNGSAVCANAIEGRMVRIKSLDNQIRVAIGRHSAEDPLTEAAEFLSAPEDGIAIEALDHIYLPCRFGDYVAVRGGKANICTCGE
jgi:hypothetical protein